MPGIALLWGSYGMATIVVYTTAMDCVRPGREGTDFTIQTVITHLSGMVMAILSGKIADHTGYHGLFFFEVSLAALSLVYILIVFRKEKEISIIMIQDLLQKYNVPVPRYTSYPPANYFTEAFANKEYESAIEASNTGTARTHLFLCAYPVLPPSLPLLRV